MAPQEDIIRKKTTGGFSAAEQAVEQIDRCVADRTIHITQETVNGFRENENGAGNGDRDHGRDGSAGKRKIC